MANETNELLNEFIDIMLTKYTQEAFDSFPIVNGFKQCPSGDYTDIRKFPGNCTFGEWSKFGNYSKFGNRNKFGMSCSFGEWSKFDIYCSFGCYCNFGKHCAFGRRCDFMEYCSFSGNGTFDKYCVFKSRCSFGEWCSFKSCNFSSDCVFGEHNYFEKYCTFGEDSRFGNQCIFIGLCICEFGVFDKMVLCSGFGRAYRTTYFFHLNNGDIFVRCGCFSGSLEEWKRKVKVTHKGKTLKKAYLSLIPSVKAQFKYDY